MKTYHIMIGFLILMIGSSAYALPNPASVNCVEKGGKSVLKNSKGYCVFSDGTYCEEWAFFRGNCEMGETKWTQNGDSK